jgi:hypothetical protein
MINEAKNWNGKFLIKVIDGKTKEVKREDIVYNRILDQALEEMARGILEGNCDLEIKYLSVGTATATIYNTTTNMGSETFRTYKALDSTVTAVGEVKNVFYILNNEAEFYIREIGVWAGSTATTTVGTGKLLSYISWIYDKATKDEEIQIIRYDSFNRSV